LIGRINLLASSRGTFGALATFAAPTLLGEESCDPGYVDEVDRASEGGGEEEVEEDAV